MKEENKEILTRKNPHKKCNYMINVEMEDWI